MALEVTENQLTLFSPEAAPERSLKKYNSFAGLPLDEALFISDDVREILRTFVEANQTPSKGEYKDIPQEYIWGNAGLLMGHGLIALRRRGWFLERSRDSRPTEEQESVVIPGYRAPEGYNVMFLTPEMTISSPTSNSKSPTLDPAEFDPEVLLDSLKSVGKQVL